MGINLENYNLSDEDLENIMEMNLDIDYCNDIQCITSLHKIILEEKSKLINSINNRFENAFINVDNIKDLTKKYSSESSKLLFSDIAILTNKLKFYSNALNQVEEKIEIIKNKSSSLLNNMI